ncbi:LuxR family transcriptional regulator [Salmonella enterica subsp. enterica serovar Braenderup]|nr:LuxR family transcriptional regulator [Salmonella enterica subsp. enterica]ECR0567613.1 LuxR family transcriptional regulator [Salmonella enterica]HEC8710335.1 LuxR family transcriptional regulator [Salmonella enterica subsp. enterica serovar Poona]
MAADLAESQNTDRAGYGNLCTGFNSDGGQTPAGSQIIRLLPEGYKNGQLAARSLRSISAQKDLAFKRSGVRNDATLLPTLLFRGIMTVCTGHPQAHKSAWSETELS